MPNTSWSSRWSASPWWPLVIWFGPWIAIALFLAAPLQSLQVVAVVNLALGPNDPIHYLIESAYGICVVSLMSYVTLAGMCLCWGPEKFWTRFGVYWLTILVGLVCWCSGVISAPLFARALLAPDVDITNVTALDLEENWLRTGMQILSAVPLWLLGIQVPFWFTRIIPGWRLRRVSAGLETSTLAIESLSIADLMTAMAIVAMYIGGLQMTFRAVGDESQAENSGVVLGIVGAAGGCGLFTALVSLPVTWAYLRLQRISIPILISLSFAALITIGVYGLIILSTPARGWRPFLSSAISAFGFLGTTTVGLWLLRRHGWMIGPLRMAPATPSDQREATPDLNS